MYCTPGNGPCDHHGPGGPVIGPRGGLCARGPEMGVEGSGQVLNTLSRIDMQGGSDRRPIPVGCLKGRRCCCVKEDVMRGQVLEDRCRCEISQIGDEGHPGAVRPRSPVPKVRTRRRKGRQRGRRVGRGQGHDSSEEALSVWGWEGGIESQGRQREAVTGCPVLRGSAPDHGVAHLTKRMLVLVPECVRVTV